jgi:thiamine biosynthesis lipoprotein
VVDTSVRAEGSLELHASIDAMASVVSVRAVAAGVDVTTLRERMADAMSVFTVVDRTCTRFDTASSLMQANASPDEWHEVEPECFVALVEAYDAYRRTSGRFDPRILGDLVRLGYDRSFRDGTPATAAGEASPPRRPLPRWRPRFRVPTRRVRLGPLPVDLGGIAKGLAVRWAATRLTSLPGGFVVEAGGDLWCSGLAVDGGLWRVGVEDPAGSEGPVAVLAVSNRAVATSSVRVRRWEQAGAEVHHLVDPRTGRPGGAGLQAVTVVGADPAAAEVWSKTLFLAGAADIARLARERDVAALWIDDAGTTRTSPEMAQHVLWSAS